MNRISLPTKSGTKGSERITERFDGTWTELSAYTVSYGAYHDDYPSFCLSDHDLQPDVSGTRGILSLIYTNGGGDAGTVDSNKPVYTCSMGQIDKPLETKSGYVCNWNYNLFYKVDRGQKFPR